MADEIPAAQPPNLDERLDQHPRFKEVVQQRRDAVAQAKALEERIAALEPRAATADTLAKQLEEARNGFAAERSGWEVQRSALQLGYTDPESLDLATYLHGKMPAEGRPALTDVLASWKAEPDKAPKAMQPYLAKPAAAPVVEPERAKTPNLNAGAAPSSAAGGTANVSGYTNVQIDAMVAEAQRLGDWTKVQEMLPKVEAQLKAQRR